MPPIHIITPTIPSLIDRIYLNGVDLGDTTGVTAITFEVRPNEVPKLTIERMPARLPERAN